jgi:hypothetical protein
MLPVVLAADVCEYPYCTTTTNNDDKTKSAIIEKIKYRMVGLDLDIWINVNINIFYNNFY